MHTSTRNSSNGPVSLFCPFWSPFQHGKHLFRVSYVCAEWHHLLCLNELLWNSCNSPFFVQDYNSISFFRCNMLKTFCSGLNCFMRSLPYNKFLSILILLYNMCTCFARIIVVILIQFYLGHTYIFTELESFNHFVAVEIILEYLNYSSTKVFFFLHFLQI